MSDILTETELADRWKITKRTLYTLRKEGQVPPCFTIGVKRFYRLDDVVAFEREKTKTDK